MASLGAAKRQMVEIARAVHHKAEVIIFDESIAEIHQFINKLADDGLAVVVISSYLPEIMNLSDRILVCRQGRVVEEISPIEASEKKIMYAAIH